MKLAPRMLISYPVGRQPIVSGCRHRPDGFENAVLKPALREDNKPRYCPAEARLAPSGWEVFRIRLRKFVPNSAKIPAQASESFI